MLNRFFRHIGLSLILISSAASSAYAQTADDLFNESAVQTLQITIHSRDWETLRANFTSNDFYPADVTWNGIRGGTWASGRAGSAAGAA
jgi:spore coat protein CotH